MMPISEDAKLLTDLGYLERCINGDLLKLQEKESNSFLSLKCSFQTLQNFLHT